MKFKFFAIYAMCLQHAQPSFLVMMIHELEYRAIQIVPSAKEKDIARKVSCLG